MDNLQHHGILGMRWGVRRFQRKDGSLTPAGKKRRGEAESGASKDETSEEKRSRLLKSTNASELYKNRDLLTTSEINERLNRIDTERRLASVAERSKKTGMDHVNTALKWGRKINEVYEFTNSPVMKAIRKKLTGQPERENNPLNLKKVWDNRGKLTDEEMTKYLKRANTEKAFKKILDEYEQASKKEKTADQKQTDNRKSTDKTNTKTKSKEEGKKKAEKKVDDVIVDVEWRDVTDTNVSIGQQYVAGFLEDKKKKG